MTLDTLHKQANKYGLVVSRLLDDPEQNKYVLANPDTGARIRFRGLINIHDFFNHHSNVLFLVERDIHYVYEQ